MNTKTSSDAQPRSILSENNSFLIKTADTTVKKTVGFLIESQEDMFTSSDSLTSFHKRASYIEMNIDKNYIRGNLSAEDIDIDANSVASASGSVNLPTYVDSITDSRAISDCRTNSSLPTALEISPSILNHQNLSITLARRPSRAIDYNLSQRPSKVFDQPPQQVHQSHYSKLHTHNSHLNATQMHDTESMHEDQKSIISYSASSTRSGTRSGFGREISETLKTKLFKMTWVFISLIVNSLLLWIIVQLEIGVIFPIDQESVTSIGGVALELVMLMSNIFTFFSLDEAAATFFGYMLSSRHGYSIVSCGFLQASAISKPAFCNQLSLNSGCRKTLSRISLVWLILESLKLLTPLGATSVFGTSFRIDSGTSSCVEYNQNNESVDRGWPTFHTEFGYAEYTFGTAVGSLRVAGANHTIGIVSPQIIGAVSNGDTIVGNGFSTQVDTSCGCTAAFDVPNIMLLAPNLTVTQATGLYQQYLLTNGSAGLVNQIILQNDHVTIVSILVNSGSCGSEALGFVQICRTKLSNHQSAVIMTTYMTDGTPASIAINNVEIRSVISAANHTWLYSAMVAILEGSIGFLPLPPTITNTNNPLLWWASDRMLRITPDLMEPGFEVAFAILVRAGIQRTYSMKGNTCTTNISVPGKCTIQMKPYGFMISICIIIFQMTVTILSGLAFIPWLLSNNPIGPAVRFLNEKIYMIALLRTSNVHSGIDQLCNAPSFQIWQNLDLVLKIGESVLTMSEEAGHIVLDKAKMVKPLVNGRRYY